MLISARRIGDWRRAPGARGARPRPPVSPHPPRPAAAGFASPSFAPPRAPLALCVVLPLDGSRSRRDAPGCCRSRPCDTTGIRVYRCRTSQVRQPPAGGTCLYNDGTQRLGVPAIDEEKSPLLGAQHGADDTRDGRDASSQRRGCLPARSSESTARMSRSAVPSSEHPQCNGGRMARRQGARRQLASPRVRQWSASREPST